MDVYFYDIIYILMPNEYSLHSMQVTFFTSPRRLNCAVYRLQVKKGRTRIVSAEIAGLDIDGSIVTNFRSRCRFVQESRVKHF